MMRYNVRNMMTNSIGAFCYEQGDKYDPEYDLGEADSSLNRTRLVILGPIQLAPKHCNCSRCEWHGDEKPCVQKYVTMNQMNKHYNDCMVSQTLDLKAQTIATIGQMQSEFRAAMKEKDEQSVLLCSQHNAFMSSLPKESRAGKERRLQQKQKDLLEKLSNRPVQKAGFKKRIVKDTPVEVVKARRALRRKESRGNKKKEEIERAANFKAIAVAQVETSVEETVAQVETSVEDTAAQVETSVEETVAQVETSVEESWQEVKKTPAKKRVALPNPAHKLACTQMCRSVGTNEPCRHGNNCRFAHDTSELVFLDCSFGLGCRNVDRQSSGVYKNKAGKTCNHMHPGETKASMCNRVGIKSDKIISMPTAPSTTIKTQQKSDQDNTKTMCRSVGVDEPKFSHEEEIVIRVPKDLALQAMEIAMKSGKTKIRIEIV